MSHTPWIGDRRMLVIPTVVNHPSYQDPPDDYADLVRRRMYYDPDPTTGTDRSLRAYIDAISYSRARLVADVSEPVVVEPAADGSCQTVAAIQAHPESHLYEYACVIFTPGTHPCGGQAAMHTQPIEFNPPRSPNLVRNRCRLRLNESLGVWAHEVIHMATFFGDLYFVEDHPGAFDVMACACGTHPSTYTKIRIGWLTDDDVPLFPGNDTASYQLHALGLVQPPPPGRVTGVRVLSILSNERYFLIECRLRSDVYEQSTDGVSSGIPGEGIVVYEVAEDLWPLKLRTPTPLKAGQSYSNEAEDLEVTVTGSIPGGFKVRIRAADPYTTVPDVRGTTRGTAADKIRNAGLTPKFVGPGDPEAVVWTQTPPNGSRILRGKTVKCLMRHDPVPFQPELLQSEYPGARD